MTGELRADLAANVACLLPSGHLTIVFPWLIVVALGESPEHVGIVQMITSFADRIPCAPRG